MFMYLLNSFKNFFVVLEKFSELKFLKLNIGLKTGKGFDGGWYKKYVE